MPRGFSSAGRSFSIKTGRPEKAEPLYLCLLTAAFSQCDDAVNTSRGRKFLHLAAGPVHFDAVDHRSPSQAKMRSRIVGRDITSTAQHIRPLPHLVCGHVYRGPHCVAWTFRPSYELQLQPVIVVSAHVAQDDRMLVLYINHGIQLAIVEEVADRQSPCGNHYGQPGSFNCRYSLKLLSAQIVKELRTLRP